MTQKAFSTTNQICKYDEYLHPTLKRISCEQIHQNRSKHKPSHKHRLSGLFTLSRTTDIFTQHSPMNSYKQQQTPSPRALFKECQRNIKDARKLKEQSLRLEKIFPKSVTIKFQDVLDSIPNNRSINNNQIKCNKVLNKTITPFKIFQIAEHKFYQEIINEKQRKQDEKNKENTNALFNVRSIKMLKKITEETLKRDELQIQKKLQKSLINISYKGEKRGKKSKYTQMFKNQTDISVEFQKENPKVESHLNIKIPLRELRKIQGLQSMPPLWKVNKSSEGNNKSLGSQNRSQSKNIQAEEVKIIYKRNKLSTRNLSLIQSVNPNLDKESSNSQFSKQKNKHKKKYSKDVAPMVFSLNQDSNPVFASLSCAFDKKYFMMKKDAIFQQKLDMYKSMLRKTAETHGINVLFPEAYSRNQFNFFVGRGNNSKLVKQTLKKRWWLGSCQQKKDLSKNNVIWTQLKDKSYYTQLQCEATLKQVKSSKKTLHNHFEQNQFLGNKKALFYNMKTYYENQSINPFDYIPLTFHITKVNDSSWAQFQEFYNRLQRQKESEAKLTGALKNIWILKPGQNSNRGNGITVHQSIESILNTVSNCQKLSRTYILQKYIQKPFLYNKRKFDIRCYMLLTRLNGKIKGYWYKEGYIRTSGYEFTLNDCQNSFIHLTNDAVQQHCDNYGKFEDKNKLSYENFQKYLDLNYNTSPSSQKKYDFEENIIPKIRKVCIDSIKACHKSLGKWRENVPTFQLFGLDFMIDQNFNPWLIQINTNPCLQTEGRVLQKVIIPLVDNAFKLSVDIMFPPPENWSNSYKHLLSKSIDKNQFEMVFDETEQHIESDKGATVKQVPMELIGQVDEDNQVYEDKYEQTMKIQKSEK